MAPRNSKSTGAGLNGIYPPGELSRRYGQVLPGVRGRSVRRNAVENGRTV